jgi:hypothetical protein
MLYLDGDTSTTTGTMAAPRLVIEISIAATDLIELEAVANGVGLSRQPADLRSR